MADFEGEKRLNRETSELEVKGKFKLSEEELDNVSGGCGDDDGTYGGHPKIGKCWKPICGTNDRVSCAEGHRCTYLRDLPSEERNGDIIYYCIKL